MLFIDTEKNEITCVYDSIKDYSQYFTDKNEVIMSLKEHIMICDIQGNVKEVYYHDLAYWGAKVKVYDNYIIGMSGPSHEVTTSYVFVRENMQKYIKSEKYKNRY